MALQVAQLGYMPNLNAPSMHNRQVIEDPWKKLAMQVLAGVVSKGVDNSLQQDYTQQAVDQGLMPPDTKQQSWWKQIVQGPQTPERQYEQLGQQQHSTDLAKAGDTATNARLDKEIAARASEGAANRGMTQQQIDLQRARDNNEVGLARDQFNQRNQFHADDMTHQNMELILKEKQIELEDTLKRTMPPGAGLSAMSTLAGDVYRTQYSQWMMANAMKPGSAGPEPTVSTAIMQARQLLQQQQGAPTGEQY